MPFGYHTQGDGANTAASEREPKNIPKTCHIDLTVSNEERDKMKFSIIKGQKETHWRNPLTV